MDAPIMLLITVALLTLYVVGVGGATAAAIGAHEGWRRRLRAAGTPNLNSEEVTLDAASVPGWVNRLQPAGWLAFPFALALGVFANRGYVWVAPVTVAVMVAINAFYFTATRSLGDPLVLTRDGFRHRGRTLRWIYVTELTAAHLSGFRGRRISRAGEWKDPKEQPPNVVFYRLNRALVQPHKSWLERWNGLTYFDGVIRNAYGIPTEKLLQTMRDRRQRALDEQGPPLRRPRPDEMPAFKNRGA